MLNHILLQFSTTPVAASGVIRAVTRSRFSHADVVITPEVAKLLGWQLHAPYGLLGASDPGGVMVRQPNYQVFLRRHRMTLVTERAAEFHRELITQIGKPFDHEAMFRTIDMNWTDWRDNGAWFCVELIGWGLERINFWSHRRYPGKMDLIHITAEDLLKYLFGEYDPEEFAREYHG